MAIFNSYLKLPENRVFDRSSTVIALSIAEDILFRTGLYIILGLDTAQENQADVSWTHVGPQDSQPSSLEIS